MIDPKMVQHIAGGDWAAPINPITCFSGNAGSIFMTGTMAGPGVSVGSENGILPSHHHHRERAA